MASQLTLKKIYIDSRYRTSDSQSASSFKFELNRSIDLPNNIVFTLQDISIPHSWYTIEEGMNDKIYFRCPTLAIPDQVITIASRNYIGTTFATELQSKLPLPGVTVIYNADRHNLTITSTAQFQIPTEAELATGLRNTWTGGSYSTSNPQSVNEVLGNLTGASTLALNYISQFLDFGFVRDIYIHSPTLTSYHTLGCRGESSIIKKIPVTSSFGSYVVDSITDRQDFLDVSKLCLRTLEFQLRDVKGNVIPLHGVNVSFSLIFSTYTEF
jgi:hypothetical protein